ncbi:hypothetical protein NHQ30_010361 [Ciborinia camelliae]|nr:hypothetical protein NHQ30_010361 [Ciborinia camelliae]
MVSNSTNLPPNSSRPISRRSTDDPFNDQYEIPLQNIGPARVSTETQRNGYSQSKAASKELRIIEDIQGGNQMCTICLEVVQFRNGRFLWHCQTCHAVTHHQCAQSWANVRGSTSNWFCPQCSTHQKTKPLGKCWCGKGDPIHDHPTTPNACRYGVCSSKSDSTCAHGNEMICKKLCHPGPCEYACGSCIYEPVPRSAKPANLHTIWGRFMSMKLNWWILVPVTVFLLLMNAIILIYVSFHIKWHTQPYLYPGFKEKFGGAELFCLLLFGAGYLVLGSSFYLYILRELTLFFGKVLNGDGSPGQIGVKFKPVRTLFGGCFLVCILLGLFALPIIGITAGPDIYWNKQMKDSCKGYDTRVMMGTKVPRSTYDFRSLSASVADQSFYLAPIFEPQVDSNQTYQYYHRFSGDSANSANIAIDVDVDNGVWRAMQLSEPDERTKWLALGRKSADGALPQFKNVNATEWANGTIESHGPHLVLPEWEAVIQGLHDAHRHREIEPFIRVYDTQLIPEHVERLMQSSWDWSPKHRLDPNILMRTASFGHGRQRLDMCLKEDFYYTSEGEVAEFEGVSDHSLIPFAVLVATRMRRFETDRLDSARISSRRSYNHYGDHDSVPAKIH